jgi:tripartite-type tricarboxylate transporter receptor subunit TctC
MASAGTGSYTHLSGELFQLATGVKLTHVPYKGTAPALVDLVGGQTHCLFDQVSTSAPHIRAGKLRALALTTTQRSALLDGVPTMAQAGVRDFEAATYTGVFLPGATPRDVVNRVYSALLAVLDLPATRDAFARLGAEVIKSTPQQWTQRLTHDLAKWKKLKAQTGIKLQ